jgi:hypothetical protein
MLKLEKPREENTQKNNGYHWTLYKSENKIEIKMTFIPFPF